MKTRPQTPIEFYAAAAAILPPRPSRAFDQTGRSVPRLDITRAERRLESVADQLACVSKWGDAAESLRAFALLEGTDDAIAEAALTLASHVEHRAGVDRCGTRRFGIRTRGEEVMSSSAVHHIPDQVA